MSGARRRDRLDEPHGVALARGCLSVLALYAGAAVLVAVLVWAAWPAGTGSPPPEPVPVTSSWSRTPVTFLPAVEEVLARAWIDGRHGCAEPVSIAVDDLAAALERDGGLPPFDARALAGRWVRQHCR